MKEIGKIIAALVVMLATFCLADVIFGIIADKTINSKSNGKPAYDLMRKEDDKLVIFGSSRASHHYDTKFLTDSLNIPSYNFGMDGRGLTYHDVILSNYLKSNKPEIVVLDLIPTDLEGGWNERISILYPYLTRYEDVERVASELDPSNNLILRSNLYRYNSALLSELKWKFEKYSPDGRGYIPLEPKPMIGMTESELVISEDVDSLSLKSLRNIAEVTDKKEIPLVIVISPIFNKLKNKDKIIGLIKQNAPNAKVIDDSGFRFGDDSNYFNDNAHLNKKGALIFTKYLMSQLESLNFKL